MTEHIPEYQLEFLLAFDGRIHHLEKGYRIKFEISQVAGTPERPHGLNYSFTLHGPDGRRLIGYDNAHGVAAVGSRYKDRPEAHDHYHRTETEAGRPYKFRNVETLIDDFFNAVERVLEDHGISSTVIEVEEREKSK